MYEFEEWMKQKMREDQRYISGLYRIGHRGGWAKVKLPQVSASILEGKPGMAATRTQKFLKARHKKLKPSRTYWVEVVGSLMSVYESEEATDPLARLQLSDQEVQEITVKKNRSDNSDESAVDEQTPLGQAAGGGKWRFNSSRSVVEVWLKLEDSADRLRVVIDLVDQDEDGLRVQVWADSLRAGVSFQGHRRSGSTLSG